MGIVVAIDGPSGSGKSTVSKQVASRLGLAYLDTGAMYRAAAWWCEHEGVDLEDSEAVTRAVETMPLTMGVNPEAPGVVCGSEDIASAIRDPHIAAIVSKVATNLDVRAELARLQREIIHSEAAGLHRAFSAGAGVVAEGRDITTVIAPDAPPIWRPLARTSTPLPCAIRWFVGIRTIPQSPSSSRLRRA